MIQSQGGILVECVMHLCFVAVVLGVISPPAYAFEPGSLGDAYRDFGYVQGCTDGGELPGQGGDGGMGAVQDHRARAAKVGDADRASHDTTRR